MGWGETSMSSLPIHSLNKRSLLISQDVDLFEEDADCSIFLYARGQSQRGPAFRLPSRKLREAQCLTLLAEAYPTTPVQNSDSTHLELYIPAPTGLLREDALKCHIATRNFFAWLCRRPLVGKHLGAAMKELLASMRAWRDDSVDNIEDVLIYADRMEYSHVEHHPDNALAMLAFAEKARIPHVWIDSFAHCTGMQGDITESTEYEQISRTTKALITRAHLEVDLHLDRTSRALASFLDHELSSSYLGLSEGARRHLDSFRSFIQAFYVGRLGYWPPFSPTNYPKDLYYDMYDDFSCLYHLLADKNSNDVRPSLGPVNGGICVQQNIEAFNARHNFNALPYSLPLLPQPRKDERRKSQVNLRVLRFNRDSSVPRFGKGDKARDALRVATNQDSEVITQSGLVQQYLEWEDEHAARSDNKVSLADARKVRWILVYGLLQTLISAIQAPPEVRDTSTANYPLCILADGLPPWDVTDSIYSEPLQQARTVEEFESRSSSEFDEAARAAAPTPTLSIHPDDETQTYFDYWTSRNGSSDSQNDAPKPALKRASTKLRKASIKRRSVQANYTQLAKPPELVSGRTLAELAYGEHSPSSADSSPVATGFSFDFGPEADSKGESLRSSEDSQFPRDVGGQAPTFDDCHNSLPTRHFSYSTGQDDDDCSVPSLTFSHRNSDDTIETIRTETIPTETIPTVPNIPYDRSSAFQHVDEYHTADSSGLAKEVAPEGDPSYEEPLLEVTDDFEDKACEGGDNNSHVVLGFTDLLAKADYSAISSDDSDDEAYDRAAVIERDGALDRNVMDSYHALTIG